MGRTRGQVTKLPETDPDSLAFTLMMIRLDGCVKCHEGSFRYMRGCQLCASQTVMQFKGEDADLVILYQKARRDVDAYLSGSPVSEEDEEEIAGRGGNSLPAMSERLRVAVIGAGPAGLAAAYDLLEQAIALPSTRPRPKSEGWPPASRRRIGTGASRNSITTGSPAISTSSA